MRWKALGPLFPNHCEFYWSDHFWRSYTQITAKPAITRKLLQKRPFSVIKHKSTEYGRFCGNLPNLVKNGRINKIRNDSERGDPGLSNALSFVDFHLLTTKLEPQTSQERPFWGVFETRSARPKRAKTKKTAQSSHYGTETTDRAEFFWAFSSSFLGGNFVFF